MINNIRVVLVNTSHPGNIGSAARAMKTMGLSKLVLVSPKSFPDEQATALAAGASDLLEQCCVVKTLEDALSDCHYVIATSARERKLPWPVCDPRESAERIYSASKEGEVAIVFGSERVGLLNEELQLAHAHLRIPTAGEYASLNLAAAVQLICYEIHMVFLAHNEKSVEHTMEDIPATTEQTECFYQNLEAVLRTIEFLNDKHPVQLMRRLRRLYQRAKLTKMEVNILQGMLTAVKKFVSSS